MPQSLKFMLALGLAFLTVGTPPLWSAPAQRQPDDRTVRSVPDARQRIVGAWQLVTRSVRKDTGELLVDPVLGQQPLGRLYVRRERRRDAADDADGAQRSDRQARQA